jgi:hypothetical protein
MHPESLGAFRQVWLPYLPQIDATERTKIGMERKIQKVLAKVNIAHPGLGC